MANDNTLGAPTEGLGQTVTFAAEGGRGPQMTPVLRQSLRNNSSGGGAVRTAQALQIPEAKQDATFSVLAKLGGELLKPHLEQERTAAYVQGMQKAAQGQAIAEIVDEQPWYSKLFGSTSLVDGARAYTATTKATSIAVDFEEKLPEYRKLSASEFSSVATKALLGTATGDAVTDMMIQSEVSKTLPTVMKNQAKAHLRYQQEVFTESIGAAADAGFALLAQQDAQARQPGSIKDDADVLGAAIRVVDSFTRPAEMDVKTHDKVIANSAIKAISTGNFLAYDVLERSGKLAQMGADEQYQIRRARHQASNDARVNLPPEFAVQLAEFKNLSALASSNDESIIAKAAEINAAYRSATGDSTPLINTTATAGELLQLRAADAARLRHAEAQRDKALTKAQKDEAEIALITGHAANVVADPSYYIGHLKKPDQQAVFNHIRAASPQNHLAAVVRQASFGVKDDVLKDQLQGAVGHAMREGDPALLAEVYNRLYAPLVASSGDLKEVVAQQYSGEFGDTLARYHKIAQGQKLDPTMAAVAYGEATRPLPKTAPDAKKLKAVTKELESGYVMSAISAVGLRDTQPLVNPEGLAALIVPRLNSSLPVDQAIEKVKRESPDLSVLGGHYWTKSTKDTNLEQWFYNNPKLYGVASDNVHRATRAAIDKYSKVAGIDGDPQIGQVLDTPTGVPQLYVMGLGSDGKVKIKTFTAEDINNDWVEANKPNPKAGSFGPAITYRADPRTPSIYAGPEEWQAYREWQATQQ